MFSNQNETAPDDKSGVDRLQKDVEAVKADISKLTGQVASVVDDLAEVARRKARRRYDQAQSNVDALVTDATRQGQAALGVARDSIANLEGTLEDAIQERPIAAIGLAVGFGFLLGATWRR